jgi:putative endonuclease
VLPQKEGVKRHPLICFMPFTVYILYSDSAGKYVGHTEDMDDRLTRHNGGRSKATKSGVPWKLMHTETFGTKSEAYQRELQIKGWKSRKMIEKLINKQ